MSLLANCPGILLVIAVLWETFETIVLPRTIVRQIRLTRLYFRVSWRLYRCFAPPGGSPFRESYLSAFGPLSLLGLIGCWVVAMIFGFALVQWGMGSHVVSVGPPGFATDLYLSGITF